MPYAVLLLGVLVLPWVAAWSFLVNGFARLAGDTNIYAVGVGTDEWAHRAVFLALFVVVAGFLWATDRWLSGIVVFAGLQTFVMGPRVVSAYLLIGIGVLAVMRRAPGSIRAHVLTLAAWSAIAQALIVLAQSLRGLDGVGSFGTSGPAACHLAACGLLLPEEVGERGHPLVRLGVVCAALALIGVAVTLTGSRAGLLAFVGGLGVRYLSPAVVAVSAPLLFAGVVLVYAFWPTPEYASNSFGARLNLHRVTIAAWAQTASTVLVGHGLGSFAQHAQAMQDRAGLLRFGESPRTPRYFLSVHDDAAQWLYETGLLGSALLAGWIARWRRRLLAPPFAPAFAVMAVMALAWFPFHDLRTSMLAALVLGAGTSPLPEGV